MDHPTDPKARRLETFLRRWLGEHPAWQYDPQTSGGRNHELRGSTELSLELVQDAEFAEIGLASWFGSPDGRLIGSVVAVVLPQPMALEYTLLVDAVKAAAEAKQREQWWQAAGATLLAGAALLALSKTVRSLIDGDKQPTGHRRKIGARASRGAGRRG
ncbi:MAG: hypothetical protein ACHQ01_11090 [Candidatus Limnocylindrales bacterium]